jgi:hypothetical protein
MTNLEYPMQHRELGRRFISPIIAPTSSISLTGPGWRCLNRDSWSDEHHVFFAKDVSFYKNTMSALAPFIPASKRGFEPPAHCQQWIIETDGNKPVGRASLQVLRGDYCQGLLFIGVETIQNHLIEDMTSQLITLAFLSKELVSIKIVNTSPMSTHLIKHLQDHFSSRIMTFSKGHLPDALMQTVHEIDRDAWFDSTFGQTSLVALGWLKKRMDRVNAVSQVGRQKKSSSWIFSLLKVGKRRRPSEMIHPLTKIRG